MQNRPCIFKDLYIVPVIFHSDTVSCKAALSVAHSEPMLMKSGTKKTARHEQVTLLSTLKSVSATLVLFFGIHPQPLSTNQSLSIPISHGLVKMCQSNTNIYQMAAHLCCQASPFPALRLHGRNMHDIVSSEQDFPRKLVNRVRR